MMRTEPCFSPRRLAHVYRELGALQRGHFADREDWMLMDLADELATLSAVIRAAAEQARLARLIEHLDSKNAVLLES